VCYVGVTHMQLPSSSVQCVVRNITFYTNLSFRCHFVIANEVLTTETIKIFTPCARKNYITETFDGGCAIGRKTGV
jgi:hypothetical protein